MVTAHMQMAHFGATLSPPATCYANCLTGAQGLPLVAHESSQQQVSRVHPPKWFQDDHRAAERNQGQSTEDLPQAHQRFHLLIHQGLLTLLDLFCLAFCKCDIFFSFLVLLLHFSGV